MKILYYTDLHATLSKPRSRKDDYTNSIFSKLLQIDKIARKEKPDIILFGGDLTNKPQESNIIFKELYAYYKNTYIPHTMIAGMTHDWYSSYESGIKNSIMSALEDTGVFKIVGEEYQCELDGVKIYSGHQAIVKTPFFGHHILYEKFNKNVDVVLTSHIHIPYETEVVNGITFIAPGSCARNSSDLYNYGRKPQVVLLNCVNSKLDKIELIPLDVELDVFHDKYLIKETEQPRSLEQMEQMIDFSDVMDAEGIIRKVGSTFSPGSVEEALRFKQKVENE